MKIVVFDLDETLGEFGELGMFCDVIEKYNKRKLTFNQFYKIMNLYPEFLRPNILEILSYLKRKKQNGECNKVMIYTNNQGPIEWAQNIRKFLEKKINYKLFDQVIAAYKVNGRLVESNRTTHDKSVSDLLRCTNLPENAKICFLDDVYHEQMEHDNVYYINVQPYTHVLPYNIMAERYYNYYYNSRPLDLRFVKYIVTHMKKYNFTEKTKSLQERNGDIKVSEEILRHLHIFFKSDKHVKTRKSKNKHKINNRTLKN